jgi:hypothetical protein
MQAAIYTFRTFPFLEELSGVFENVFVLGSLKKDIEHLSEFLLMEKPQYCIGIAIASVTRQEPIAVNRFNQKAKVLANGPDEYGLSLLFSGLACAELPTGSFCNWGMYRVAHILEDAHASVRHGFIHVSKEDFPHVLSLLRELYPDKKNIDQ